MNPGFADDVLAWGRASFRDLPWRRVRDPWAILVSEVMLQQTQVVRVVERWPRFLARFPTPPACAASPLGDVLTEWQGLGYPRRARSLHATAQRVAALGGFPRDLDELLALPGVGPYTARAVQAFAFEDDAAVVDTNIARIYARLSGRRLTAREAQAIADAALPAGDAWSWNQCLMDLGASICRPTPDCDGCPVRGHCAWAASGGPDPAVGSAGVSRRQSRFEGSDRQARGRLMKALTAGPVRREELPSLTGRDPLTAERLLADLAEEGLCEHTGDEVTLPGAR